MALHVWSPGDLSSHLATISVDPACPQHQIALRVWRRFEFGIVSPLGPHVGLKMKTLSLDTVHLGGESGVALTLGF